MQKKEDFAKYTELKKTCNILSKKMQKFSKKGLILRIQEGFIRELNGCINTNYRYRFKNDQETSDISRNFGILHFRKISLRFRFMYFREI